jgi:hypothetical protein
MLGAEVIHEADLSSRGDIPLRYLSKTDPSLNAGISQQRRAAGCWPAPEVAENVNTAELGNLGLSADEEAAIVAFLKTLSDGFVPGMPKK